MSVVIDLPDLAATEAFAARLAGLLAPPLVVGLVGDLGAGKTALVRAMVQALAPGTRVKSPTYTLIESYDLGDRQIHHLDLYRLRHPDELAELGLADLLGPRAILLIEWPDKGGEQTPALDLELRLERIDDTVRRLVCVARSDAGRRVAATLSG